MEKPKIKFIARSIYKKIYLKPACDKSIALCDLLSRGPRATLESSDLAIVGRMGFDIEIVGDVKELKKEQSILEKT